MARVPIPIQALNPNGGYDTEITFTTADAANDHYFNNNGQTVLLVKNDSGGAITITVSSIACSHGRTSDISLAVDAGKIGVIGPLPPDLFNQIGAGDLGKVFVGITDDTSLSFAAVSYQGV